MGGGAAFKPAIKLAQSVGVIKPASKPVTTTAPTAAEVSQSAATDMDQISDARKRKRRGRSATILTSSSGVEGDTTLGTKSLLGG